MRLLRFKYLLIISLFWGLPFNGYSWGLLGHRIVGQVAETYLTPRAKASVLKILGTESMAMASNWPDFIKSDTAYNYLSTWHYVNIKQGLNWDEVKNFLDTNATANAYNRINFLVKELKSNNVDIESKRMYLRILIHLVGDIHQPLHVGRPEDRGGNNIKVLWFSTPYNLHQIWDQVLINFQQLSYTEYATAINHPTASKIKMWQKETLAQWFYQSYNVANKIYADVKEPDQKLDYQYNFKYLSVLDEQLLKGGVRLAGLLNSIFK
ncbi:MAG: S1/P1 nuclease [Ferruginibacter sp.]